jgi:hypothetical protein
MMRDNAMIPRPELLPTQAINLERLLKLRLVVARVGEKDNARWWNTDRMLGPLGASALKRGFPRTHRFAQARAVFTVATTRCRETYDPPGAVTLWKLPAAIEDQFSACWPDWLDQADRWGPFFGELEAVRSTDVLGTLRQFSLVGASEEEQAAKLRRSAENRAVAVPSGRAVDDRLVTLLAAGFHRGEPGGLAVPYARVEDQG